MDANTFFINQQLRQLASQADSAMHRVRQVNSLRQLKTAAHVSVPGYLSPMARTLPELRRLANAAERRATELVSTHLGKLEAIAKEDKPAQDKLVEAKKVYGLLLRDEWIYLRGDFSLVYSQAVRKADRILGSLQVALKADT